MADQNALRDDNRITILLGENESGEIRRLKVTDSTDRLKVDAVISGGGADGVQYTEGDTDADFIGTIAMAEGAANTAVPLQVDSDKRLQVDIAADSVGIGGGTQYDDGEADPAPAVGNVSLGTDGSNLRAVSTDSDGNLQVDVLTSGLPSGAATSAKQDTIIGHVDGIEGLLTTIDGDTGTLAGTVAGSEIQADIVGALPAGNNNIGDVDVASIAAGTNDIGRVGHNVTGIGHGVQTVATAGTDVALAASTACKSITIQAQTDNTGLIAIGATGVDATVATGTGVLLSAGESISIPADNLADIFIDSTVNGDGVRYTYYT